MPLSQRPRWYALPLLALGVAGFAAAWALVALSYDRQLAWLAPLAAADMVLMLGIGRWPAGLGRACVALLATIATLVAANFGIVAGQVGRNMGLMPWDSALKLGPSYALELVRLATSPSDLGFYALGLLIAVWAGVSARRPAPSAR